MIPRVSASHSPVCLAVFCAFSCSPADHPKGHSAATSAATAVATADGIAVTESDIRAAFRSHRDVKSALREAVRAGLLVAEAKRRGLERHVTVTRARKRALANVLVRKVFAKTFTLKSVPMKLIEKAYRANKRRYVHPDLVDIDHIVALARTKDRTVRKEAYRLARKVWEIASSGRLTKKEFRQIPGYLKNDARKAGIKLRLESLTTPKRGATVEAFADAAFALKKFGDVSDVVETKYGYHVIYFKQLRPARNDTLSEVAEQIRKRIFEDARRLAWREFVEKLERRYGLSLTADKPNA